MKTKLYLIGGIVIGLSLSLGTIAEAAFVPISVPAGGTGSTTAQTVGLGGILAGNGKAAIKSVVIGSNLTWDGTTLSATGGGSSFAYPFPSDSTTTVLTLTNGASIPKLTNLTSNGFVKTGSGNGTLSIDTNTYLTGNQTITLSGDVSGSGATSITTAIGANKVTVGMLAQAAANTILGNPTGSTANIQAFATSSLGIAISDTTGTLAVNRGGTGVATFTGIPKGNGTSAFTVAANGTDYTLITANSCGAGNHVSAITAAGAITCSADTGAGGTGLATTSPISGGNILAYTATGSGFAYGVATSSLSVGSSLTSSGTLGSQIGGTDSQLSLNLANSNTWTALQRFANASSTLFSNTGKAYFGATATTTIDSAGNVSLPTSAVLTVGNSGNSTNQAITIGGTGQGIYAPSISTIALGGTGVQFASFNAAASGVSTTTPGSLFSIGTNNGINFRTATSTFSSTGGIDLAAGCFAVAGVCVGGTGGGGSGTVGSGTTGQFPYYAANGTTLTATSTISVAPNRAVSLTTDIVHMGTTTCDLGLVGNGAIGAELCGRTFTPGGLIFQIENDSDSPSAFGGLNFDNDQSTTALTFAGLFFNSSTYNYTGYGTALAVPSNLSIENTQGTVSFIAASTTANGAYFNWLTLGANTNNEVMRLTAAGNLGIGTTTPQGKLQVATPTNAANAFSVTNAVGSTTLSVGTLDSVANVLTVASSTGQNYLRVTNAGYLVLAGTSTPALSSCGTSPSILNGGPLNFSIQVGSVSATGCTATFPNTPLPTAPVCNVTNRSSSITNAMTYTVSTTAVVVTQTGLTGAILDVNCFIGNTS